MTEDKNNRSEAEVASDGTAYKCPPCNGTGFANLSGEACKTCRGEGRLDYEGLRLWGVASLMETIHANNVAKGFSDSMADVHAQHMLFVTELAESYDEVRKGKPLTEIYYEFEPDPSKPLGVPIELADEVIRIFGFCQHHGIDLATAIRVKMGFNTRRPWMHGKKF